MHGFFDWFRRQATISCYMCVRFCRFLCVLMVMCLMLLLGFEDKRPLVAIGEGFLVFLCFLCHVRGFLIGLADWPPLLAICVFFCFLFSF